MIGAGGGNGAMDAANILNLPEPRRVANNRGYHPDEYQKYFERDKALVRRFQTCLRR